jgi:hypothetical protein
LILVNESVSWNRLGHLKVRKVQGPILDTIYARLKKCSDLACTGKPFTEHHNVPDLLPSANGRLDWEQVADRLRTEVESGTLPAGSDLPSVRDLQAWQGIRRTTLQRAFRELSEQGLIVIRQGRTGVVAGEPPADGQPGVRHWRPSTGHDCRLAGCERHVCSPMKPGTIRQVHSILSGAFDAAKRWQWVEDNPAESAKPPTVTLVKRPATAPADVAKVIAEGRAREMHQIALYLWLSRLRALVRCTLTVFSVTPRAAAISLCCIPCCQRSIAQLGPEQPSSMGREAHGELADVARANPLLTHPGLRAPAGRARRLADRQRLEHSGRTGQRQ